MEEYYAGVNWLSPTDTRKVLRAYEEVLRALEERLRVYEDADARTQFDKLVNLLKRDGLIYENGQIVSAGAVDLTTIEDAPHIIDRRTLHDHIRRIEQSIDSDQAQAIGSAKELVETIAKHVLVHYGDDPARLVVGAAATLARFLLETLDARKQPRQRALVPIR